MTTRTYYLHTLNGEPAGWDGSQISYVSGGARSRGVALLRSSLQQIRREQQAAIRFRAGQGWGEMRYSYVRVVLPAGDGAARRAPRAGGGDR